uniref:Methyltransferase domain-containing protein n=1 Tax=Odontella aurita TaxID=265563 RepID=A0A7S4J126_9STRA|mmetsp:Transcript_3535/g.9250  ORF Transcript_3535/g.9250 Transcript_3535/m.9250 type:complete len:413 (+) Transcript_3535:83-1321(+)
MMSALKKDAAAGYFAILTASAAGLAGLALVYGLRGKKKDVGTKRTKHDDKTGRKDLSWQERSVGVTRSRFRTKQTGVRVVCAPTASEYGRCIEHCIDATDSVLVLCGTAGGTKSLDGGAAFAAKACCAEPCIYRGDIWDFSALRASVAATPRGPSITAICLDATNIHGNDILMDTFVLVKFLRSIFAPSLRIIIVKSRTVARHARSVHTAEDFINAGGMEGLAKESSSKNAGGFDEIQVVCAVGVANYRKTIPFVVKKGDDLLEIGCHHGKTTFLLADAAAEDNSKRKASIESSAPFVVGVDIGKVCIDRANEENRKLQERNLVTKKSHNQCSFEIADAWNTKHLLSLSSSFNAIYIDVGGISGSDGVFEGLSLIRQISCAYSATARCIVVKSRCLRDHASMWMHSDRVLRK